MDKYINDKGEVGIIIHNAWGGGWSTWADCPEFLAMDKTLVGLKVAGASSKEAMTYINSQRNEEYDHSDEWDELSVRWLPVGTKFFIDEYDGNESIVTNFSLHWTA